MGRPVFEANVCSKCQKYSVSSDLLERFQQNKAAGKTSRTGLQNADEGWVPAIVMSAHVPFRTKMAMLKNVKAIRTISDSRVLRHDSVDSG